MIVSTAVLVPADVAGELARFADAGRDRMRHRDGYRMSGPCEQTIAELQAVARATRFDLATTRAPEDDSCTLQSMTTAEFAKRHSITTQAVTDRCRRGTLPAQLINGQWRIYTEEDNT